MRPSSTIRIDLSSTTPVYRQIADAIRAVLVAGGLPGGEQLPTIRALAMDLAVHPNTVAGAYRMLEEEGFIELGRRRGATVIARKAPRASAEEVARFVQKLRVLIAEAKAAGVPMTTLNREFNALTV